MGFSEWVTKVLGRVDCVAISPSLTPKKAMNAENSDSIEW